MLLSSPEKIAFYCDIDINPDNTTGGLSKSIALKEKRHFIQWRSSISHSFQHYLGRDLTVQTRTEDFDTQYRQATYFPQAIPILSIASVYADSLGQYNGNEYELTSDDYIIGKDSRSIVFTIPVIQAAKGLRITYTGGLAYHAVNSSFTITDMTGTPTTIHYARGETSESVGKVVSWTPATSTLVVSNLFGCFEVGESLTFQTVADDNDSVVSGISGTLSAIPQPSIAQAHPDLETAVAIETRYMWQHRKDFENISSDSQGNTSRRGSTVYQNILPFQPETLAILDRYRRYWL